MSSIFLLAVVAGVVGLALEGGAELDGGLEEAAGLAGGFHAAVELGRAGAQAVAEHPGVCLAAQPGHAGAWSPLALGAALVAIGTAASRARGRALLLVALLAVLGSVAFPLVNPAAGEILKVGFPAFLFTVIAFGWGLYARAPQPLWTCQRKLPRT